MFEYVLLPPLADRLLGRPLATHNWALWNSIVQDRGWQAAVRQSAVDQLELALRMGHDMMYVLPNPAPPAPPAKREPAPSAALRDSDDPIERLAMRNDRAAAVEPPGDETLLIYAMLKEEMCRRDVDLPILAPAYAHGVWTDTDLMMAMVLAPEVAHRHFELATDRTLALVEKYLALGLDQIGVGGDFSGTRPLIAPEAYRKFIVPQVRRLSRCIHAAGRWSVNASDGNLWPVLVDFTAGCEVDGYLEIDMHAGMDLAALKAAVGARVTLYGNLDCGNTLSFASPEQVRAHTLACLEAGQGDGGHILCASNAIIESVPMANYLAVINAYRDMFSLPRFQAE